MKAYWMIVMPQSSFPCDEATAVQSLVVAGRPGAAFAAIQWALECLESVVLVALLRAMANGEGGHPTIRESQIRETVKAVEAGDTLTAEEKAQLFFVLRAAETFFLDDGTD